MLVNRHSSFKNKIMSALRTIPNTPACNNFSSLPKMKVQYVLLDTFKTTRANKCVTCEKIISDTTVWYSFQNIADLCFNCFNTIRKLSIIPENNPNRPITSSLLTEEERKTFIDQLKHSQDPYSL